jgi:hypothetical protein
LTLKGYTKDERVLRFEAIVHNTKQLGCGRTLDKFAQITTRLTAMVDRFTSTLDCVDTGLRPDGILDQLPAPSQLAAHPDRRYRHEHTPGSCRPRRSGSRWRSPRPGSPSRSSPPKYER